MSSSTIPAVKAQLQAQLQARGGLSGVEVSYGKPSSQHKEFIWLADVESDGQVMATAKAGGPTRNEEYDLLAVIRSEQSGRNQRAVTERAYALLDEIASQLRTDTSVNGAVGPSGWAQLKGVLQHVESMVNDGPVCKLLIAIHVKARI